MNRKHARVVVLVFCCMYLCTFYEYTIAYKRPTFTCFCAFWSISSNNHKYSTSLLFSLTFGGVYTQLLSTLGREIPLILYTPPVGQCSVLIIDTYAQSV
jgi:hypothetical protein